MLLSHPIRRDHTDPHENGESRVDATAIGGTPPLRGMRALGGCRGEQHHVREAQRLGAPPACAAASVIAFQASSWASPACCSIIARIGAEIDLT